MQSLRDPNDRKRRGRSRPGVIGKSWKIGKNLFESWARAFNASILARLSRQATCHLDCSLASTVFAQWMKANGSLQGNIKMICTGTNEAGNIPESSLLALLASFVVACAPGEA